MNHDNAHDDEHLANDYLPNPEGNTTTTWNHRIIRTATGTPDELLNFGEVFYTEDNKPSGWTDPFMCSDDIQGLEQLIERLQRALTQPIIDESEFS